MAIVLYDLAGETDERRFSPFCWRAKMAVAHKELAFETVPWRFTEKDSIAFSGQGRVPVIRDGARTVSDSWEIACYLEDAYPDRPSLFGGAVGRGLARFVNAWVDRTLHAAVFRVIVKDIHDHAHPKDRAYFRKSRETRLGATLEDVHARRAESLAALQAELGVLRAVLARQDFMSGAAPAYGDYIVFGAFQWARAVSPTKLVEPGDAVHAWRGRMLDLFDGLGRSTAGYPE